MHIENFILKLFGQVVVCKLIKASQANNEQTQVFI